MAAGDLGPRPQPFDFPSAEVQALREQAGELADELRIAQDRLEAVTWRVAPGFEGRTRQHFDEFAAAQAEDLTRLRTRLLAQTDALAQELATARRAEEERQEAIRAWDHRAAEAERAGRP